MRPSRGVRRRRARAGWWRCHAWVGSITNTADVQREPIGRKCGRHNHCDKCDREVTLTLSIREYEKGKIKCPKCGGESLRPLLSAFMSQTSKKSCFYLGDVNSPGVEYLGAPSRLASRGPSELRSAGQGHGGWPVCS